MFDNVTKLLLNYFYKYTFIFISRIVSIIIEKNKNTNIAKIAIATFKCP